MLLDFGVLALLPRETAYATGEALLRTVASRVPVVIGHAIRVLFFQTPVMILAALCLWFWMPAQWMAHRDPIGMLALAFALTFPTHVFRAVLEGLQDMKYLGQVQMLVGSPELRHRSEWSLRILAFIPSWAGGLSTKCFGAGVPVSAT